MWLAVSSGIYMIASEGTLLDAPNTDILRFMFRAQVLGLMVTCALLFILRLLLPVPFAFGFFDEKPLSDNRRYAINTTVRHEPPIPGTGPDAHS